MKRKDIVGIRGQALPRLSLHFPEAPPKTDKHFGEKKTSWLGKRGLKTGTCQVIACVLRLCQGIFIALQTRQGVRTLGNGADPPTYFLSRDVAL